MTIITVDTKFQPLLPLALRPDATRGLAIAFGMGTAFRTSLIAGVTTDAVELVPSVPEMFKWFYDDADAVLADPNGKVIIADGRNHVELTDQLYDFDRRRPAAARSRAPASPSSRRRSSTRRRRRGSSPTA